MNSTRYEKAYEYAKARSNWTAYWPVATDATKFAGFVVGYDAADKDNELTSQLTLDTLWSEFTKLANK